MSDSVGFILSGLKHAQIPDKTEQLLLARRIQAGLAPDATPQQQRSGVRARQRLVQGNMRLAVNIARGLFKRLPPGCALGMEDLIQESMLGLNTAALKFDPERGFAFSTYATWWCRQAVSRAIEVHGRTIRLPNNALTMVRRWRYRDPIDQSVADFAAEHDYTTAEVVRILNSAALTDVKSLDFHTRLNDSEGSTLLDLVAAEAEDPLAGTDEAMAIAALEAALPEELELLERSVVLGERTTAIAADLGVSRQAVNDQLKRARNRLAVVGGSQARELVA